eukprot:1880373-Pleurochrysis_carterae.AAC.1
MHKYERPQLECYLRLYGKTRGVLLEEYDGELHYETMRSDDAMWERGREAVLRNVADAIK